MTDDDSSNPQEKSWLGKLTNAFSSEPKSREELTLILRAAHESKVIDNEALEIIEGALNVADQQVR